MARNLNWYQRFTYFVVNYTEHFFCSLGYAIGNQPKKTIAICWVFVAVSSLGFLRFYQEKNPVKLWVPPKSQFAKDTEWLVQKLDVGYRENVIQIVADDVLRPEILQYIFSIDEKISTFRTNNNVTWEDICFRIPKIEKSLLRFIDRDKYGNSTSTTKDAIVTINAVLYCSFVEAMKKECYKQTILDLFDTHNMKDLTKDDILYRINTYDRNDILGRFKDFEGLLGGVERNDTGHIISAKSLQNYWMLNLNFTTVDFDKVGNIGGTGDWASLEALDWEEEFISILKDLKPEENLTLFYSSARSFGDISSGTMFQDLGILILGVFISAVYVLFVLSKFNWLEFRVVLGCAGLLSVGMSFLAGCGLCSLFGVSYGPVHTSLPFLLMGLGVDDMFVIMACWDALTAEQKALLAPERTGLILKHAGVSITVTSVTDILAFVIGSSTILPSLESYCIFAGVCVSFTFFFAVTFFTACLVLDQKRVDENRNGILVCYKHVDYKPNECSRRQTSNMVFHYLYDNIILTLPGKVCVIIITVICLGYSINSCLKLEQRFDPKWFVPENTYLAQYFKARNEYFPHYGFNGGIYMGALNYTHELKNIESLVRNLEKEDKVVLKVLSWLEPFREFVAHNFITDIHSETLSEEYFHLYLSMFLHNPRTAPFQAQFQFEKPLECGVPAPKIIMSSIDFQFVSFPGPELYLPAMRKLQEIAITANFTTGDKFVTSWSKIYATWVTDEVIDEEVLRNLQLALLCVMTCTAILIADLQTCFWIFMCVLLTMVNVCGFMQQWGLTIDIVSCIGLELAIGLCVDYASHVGHTFLTIETGTRRERSLKTVTTIGSAVVYGGISMLIGIVMLSQSDAYTFQSFFKIFFLVVLFGLFHGVVLLPVVLSIVGPKPYKIVKVREGEINLSQS